MDRFVHAIYCDDIRYETGNKQSFMGIYNGVLFVQQAPILLAKLCVAIHARTPANRPFTSDVTMRVLKDDEIFAENVVKLSGEIPDDVPEADVSEKMMIANGGFVFSPFPIEGPITLRIRVIVDGEEIKGPALRIGIKPPAMPTQ